MANAWKWTALGLLAMAGVVATSTLTTAYLMRPPAAVTAPAAALPTVEHREAVVRITPAPLSRAASVSVPRAKRAAAPDGAATSTRTVAPQIMPKTPGPVDPPVSVTPAPAPPTPQSSVPGTAPTSATSAPTPPPTAVASVPSVPAARAPADCETGGDRALRIAKPGALGAVLGAGLGAAGGAIANGGKGAGKGALIGGLAGAALGTGYGAYKTQNECGTIFGSRQTAADATSPTAAGGAVAARPTARDEVMAPLQSTPSEGRIQVYGAR